MDSSRLKELLNQMEEEIKHLTGLDTGKNIDSLCDIEILLYKVKGKIDYLDSEIIYQKARCPEAFLSRDTLLKG